MWAEKRLYIPGIFFEAVALGAAILYPQLLRLIIDQGVETRDTDYILRISGFMVGLLVIQAFANFLRLHLLLVAAQRASTRLREMLFGRLLSQDVSFFDEHPVGELISRLNNDAGTLAFMLQRAGPDLVHAVISGVAAAGLMFYTSPLLSSVMLVVGPLIWYGTNVLGRRVRNESAALQTRGARLSEASMEALIGVQTVHIYRQEDAEQQRQVERGDELIASGRRLARADSLLRAFSTFATEGGVVLAVAVGGILIARGSLTTGSLVSLVFYATMVMSSLRNVSDLFSQLMRAEGATARIFELADREPRMRYRDRQQSDRREVMVRLEGVEFSYPSRPDQPALKGVDLEIDQGEIVALVGASGSGKSTIAKLIARLYDPDSGKVTLNQIDMRDADPEWLRSRVTLVPSDPTLFARSVADNIRFGCPNANDAEVRAAAGVSQALDFIDELEAGFDTWVGDQGQLFSTGQRQRIAIARALLRRPGLLILDEATAAIDAERETLIKRALRDLEWKPAVILVAHRLSTIVDVDRVILVQDGRVRAEGTHDQLMASSREYRELVEQQIVKE